MKTTRLIITVVAVALAASTRVEAAQQMRVGFTQTCPASGKARESALAGVGAAILVDIAGRVVGGAIDALAHYLTNDKATSFTAAGRMNAFAAQDADGTISINASEACVVVVVGTSFNSALSDSERAQLPQLQGVPQKIQDASRDIAKVTGLVSGLSFYFEGVLQPDKVATGAFTLVPKYWYYPKFLSDSGWQYKKERDVLFKIELATPGDKAFASWDLQWQAVTEGQIKEQEVTDRVIPWSAYPSGISKLQHAGLLLPVNASVLLTETSSPYTIVKYVGQALAAQKDQITTDVKTSLELALSQQARLDARKAALADVDVKYKAYSDAYTAAKAAYDTYTSATDAAKPNALALARIAYAKVDVASAYLRAVYQSASIGDFPAFPPLPQLP